MALGGEQGAGQGHEPFSKTVRQQAVVADTHEAPGQDMQEEAAQELDGIEGHDTLDSAVPIIAPAEADFFTIEGGDAVVRYSHAVGVTAEISEDPIRTAEGWLGIDVPVLLAQLCDQLLEPRGITEIPGGPAAIELILAVEMAKSGKELHPEDVVQYGNGQEESWVVGRNPALMIWGQSTAGDYAMHVIMAQQGLTPGVQDGEKSYLCAEPFRISSDFEQGLGTGVEEQIEKWPGRSQGQRVQFVRHGEHDVEVVGVE